MATRVNPSNVEQREMIEPPHQSKTNKFISWVVVGALVVIGISIAIFLKWSFASDNVLVVNNSPFPVRSVRPHAESNGVIILNVDYCKNVNIKGQVRTSFVSSSREVFLPVSDENQATGCHQTEVPILIPKDLPPDTYKIKFRATYDLNPLKKNVVSEFESQQFRVDKEQVMPQ